MQPEIKEKKITLKNFTFIKEKLKHQPIGYKIKKLRYPVTSSQVDIWVTSF
jgi:hypothetical protein